MSTPLPGRAFTRASLPDALASLLTLTFLAVLIRTAWLSDDALITLRTVMNVTHGFGLRFNIDERVQTYTHPLWLAVLTAAYYLTSNVYFAAFMSSLLLSVLAFWTAITRAASAWQGATVVVILFFSRAFVDFSTSGLENPLSCVLLAWFVFTIVRLDHASAESGVTPGSGLEYRRALTRLWLLASLLYLTRPDDIVLVVPLLLMATWRGRGRGAVRAALIGLVPAAAWTGFAIVYYGFPFPNTAYAKLSMGIDPSELRTQGVLYLIDSIDRDPLTLTTILFAVLLAFKQRHRTAIGLAAGLLLYLGYIVSIGGDFMAGRFLAVPLFGAALLVGTWAEGARPFWIAATVLFAALGSAGTHLPLWSNSSFGDSGNRLSGIIDERGVYFHDKSLVLARRSTFREPDWPKAGAVSRPYQVMPTCGLMGTAGLDLGPYVHLLDECALADPLLAHLPAIHNPDWRTGHYRRMIPAGYKETLERGEDVIKDRGLHDYYEHLSTLTRSERIWSWLRLKEIVAVDAGRYDHLIDRIYYRYGGVIATPNELANERPDGTPWNDPLNHVLTGQLAVVYGGIMHPSRIDISLDSDDRYFLTFLKKGRLQSTMELGPIPEYRRTVGLMRYRLDIPPRAARDGFDLLLIAPGGGDGHYAIGHLIVQ
jgi:arabinofuranosyltransferase